MMKSSIFEKISDRSSGELGAGENSEQGKVRARPCSIPVHQNRSRGKFGAGENWEQGGIGSKEELAIALNKKSGYLYTRGLDNSITRQDDLTAPMDKQEG